MLGAEGVAGSAAGAAAGAALVADPHVAGVEVDAIWKMLDEERRGGTRYYI